MKHIIKTPSPSEFEKWKGRKHLTEDHLNKKSNLNAKRTEIWNTFTKKTKVKNTVKESLLNEQGYICCYCQQHIELNEQTTIEHFIARATNATKMFDYDNIFACCDGGQKQRTERNSDDENNKETEVIPKYCGHARDNSDIPINPLDKNCETHFSYSFNPDSEEVLIEGLTTEGIDTVSKLNLGIAKLNNMRGAEIAGYIMDGDQYISTEEAEALLKIIKQKQDGKFYPFCAVLEYVLNNLPCRTG